MATRIPDRRENARRFAELEGPHRRAIIRTVNRGRAAEGKRDAVIAIGVARRQQRFWRRAWLIAPVLGVVQAFTIDPLVALLNAAVAGGALGTMAWWFWSRARRAERANLLAVGARVADDDTAQRGLFARLTGRGAASTDAAPPPRRPGGSTRERASKGGGDGGKGGDDGGRDPRRWWRLDRRSWRRDGGRGGEGGPRGDGGGQGGRHRGGHLPGTGSGGHLPGASGGDDPRTGDPDTDDTAAEGGAGDLEEDRGPGRGQPTARTPGRAPYRPRGNKRRR